MSDVGLLSTVLDLLTAPSLSLSFLSLLLSLTITYEVSLHNTYVLQSPWKQWEQRCGQGTVRQFFMILPVLPNALVINTCTAHAQRSGFFLWRQDLPQQHAAGVCRVDSSSPLPGSTLLFLVLITDSVSGTAADNKLTCCYQESHTVIATLIDMLLKARIIWGLSLLLRDCHWF